MNDEETVSLLRTLGLNLYESRAYLALIKGKELTAKGVGQSAVIPQSRTYDVLESLSRKGFALATPGSPATYVPVPPSKILGSQYEAEKKKIQESIVKVQQEAQEKLDGLREAYAAFASSFPARISEQLAVRDRVWVLQTRENIESALIQLIKEAKSTVLRITRPPNLRSGEPLDPFYIVGMENRRYLYDALERKVRMKWLSLAREIPTFSGLDVGEPPERRYIEDERDITEKFLLVDSHSVLLNLHDPASPAYGSVALAMQSKAAASIFLDHFEKVWARGRPLGDILPRMKELVKRVSAKLREIGLSRSDALFYQTLAKFGAVSRETVVNELMKRRIQPQESLASCDLLIRLGLVYRDNTYRVLIVEHPGKLEASLASGMLVSSRTGKITTRKSPSGKNP